LHFVVGNYGARVRLKPDVGVHTCVHRREDLFLIRVDTSDMAKGFLVKRLLGTGGFPRDAEAINPIST
jgi:hypothetical protein